MSVTEAVGWIAALSSACVALPQALRILATRSIAGISMLIWQMTLVGGIAWGVHGLLTARPQITWPNLLLTATSAWVLAMVCRGNGTPLRRALVLPVSGAALAFGIEVAFGPVAFGVAMFIPAAVGQVSQLRTIQRSLDTTGVSLSGLVVSLACQLLWLGYAFPAGESAIIVTATPTAVLISTTIATLQIRRSRAAALVLLG